MGIPFKVICIDDSHRPAEVPTSQWIKKDEIYTVIRIVNCLGQGIVGYELAEVTINSALYKFFAAKRFALIELTPADMVEEEAIA